MSDADIKSFYRLSPTGIAISDDISYEDWERLGDQLHVMIDVGQWALGGWSLFGERKFGDDHTRAISPDRSRRVEQARWVWLKIPVEIRRESLSYSHHRAIAGIDDIELQKKLLDMAEANKWQVSTLAAAAKEAKKSSGAVTQPGAPAEVTSTNRLFGATGRTRDREPLSPSNLSYAADQLPDDPAPQGFTPRIVAGKDVEPAPDNQYAFFWAVVAAAREAIAKGEITDALRKAVADVDALEAIAKRSVG